MFGFVGQRDTQTQVELSPKVSLVVRHFERQLLVLLSDHVPFGQTATQTRLVLLMAYKEGTEGHRVTQYLVEKSAKVVRFEVLGQSLTHCLVDVSAKRLWLIGQSFTHLKVLSSLKVLNILRQLYMQRLFPSSA